MLEHVDLRREGHDPQRNPPGAEVPDPNDPIETPRGAEPGPDPDAPHAPEPDTQPVLGVS